jgi:hypothetical protein
MAEHFRRNRVLRIIAGAAVVEAALLLVVKLSPAMEGLLSAATAIVVVSFGIAAWHAAKEREGDRRSEERRRG